MAPPPLSFLVFVAVLSAVAAAAHLYAWRRLVRDVLPPGRRRTGATLVLVTLAATVPVGFSLWRWLGADAARPFSWAGAAWAGVLFLLVVVLGVLDVARTVAARARPRRSEAPVDAGRRRFLARTLAGVAGATTAGAAATALAQGAAAPEIVRVRVPIRGLPPAFDGFSIAHLSDVHVGPILHRAFLEDVVARTNALDPDLVAITGDLVDGSVEDLADVVAPLASLRARHGVWFTTGNHEYYMGADAWLAHLATLGVRPLRNERTTVERDGAAIDVAGVDDASAHRFGGGHGADPDRALAGRVPGRPVVMLAHQPKQVHDARRLGVDLVLAGHTHGGQIAPFGWLVRLAQPAVAGLHRFGDTWLYVSRGVGTWGPPMRLCNPAEIALVTLVPEA